MALSARALRLWDTCAYVRRFTESRVDAAIEDDIRRGRFLLASVVAMELHAGARDAGVKRAIDDLVRHLDSLDRLVWPDFSDYQRVGVALSRYRSRHGAIEPRAHFRDALITVCAARRGAVVVSDNVRDFERWRRWLGVRHVIATKP